MNVKQLKKLLKGIPEDLEVFLADHDHSEYETNGKAGSANVVDRSEMSDYEIENEDEVFKGNPEKYFVIRI